MNQKPFTNRKKKISIIQRLKYWWQGTFERDYRSLAEIIVWPFMAILTLGTASSAVLLPAYEGEWTILFMLLVAGMFLSIQMAAALGSMTFITYGMWLFSTQLDSGLTGAHFILLSFMPFTPVWLSAMRLKVIDIIHLAALLELPQVRAAMNVSAWSLLPSHRALELRLQQHVTEYENNPVPAVLVRFNFTEIERLVELLGENIVLHEVKAVSDALREKLRTGDMIAEDVEDHSMMYVLAFPNPKSDYRQAIIDRLSPVMELAEFDSTMEVAVVPDDGEKLYNITWHHIRDKKSPFV